MAEVKILKIASGLPNEHDAANDDIIFASFEATSGGPKLSSTGLDMQDQTVSGVDNITFTDTEGAIAGIENKNLLDKTASEDITGDYNYAAGDLRLPVDATAAPSSGHIYFDTATDKLWIYDGTAWKDMTKAQEALYLDIPYTVDEVAGFAIGDCVYISANDTASLALANGTERAYAIGFATEAKADTETCEVRVAGVAPGVVAGATAGDAYYLDASTAGDLTTTPPSASGKDVVRCGFANNATDLFIQIQYIGKRA